MRESLWTVELTRNNQELSIKYRDQSIKIIEPIECSNLCGQWTADRRLNNE